VPPSRFDPAWWLPNGHLQTLWGPLCRRPVPVITGRECWPTPDGDTVTLHRLPGEDTAPRLLLLHGLEGSPASPYVRGMLAGARARGWKADVLVFRGCGGEPNRVRRFYHSGDTEDLDLVVKRLRSRGPGEILFAAGFSLGGNVLLKWLGELGPEAPLQAAAAISVPYDLEQGARHIHRGFSRIYERNFLRSLQRKAIAKHRFFADLPHPDAVRRTGSIVEFDDLVTAPVHGFRDARDYYEQSSAVRWLSRVAVPTLLVSARDDPFLPRDVLRDVEHRAAANAALTLEIHGRGGHVGFVAGRFPWSAAYYAEERLFAFFADRLIPPPVRRK
jgi:uncharacterized protein